MNKDTKIHCRIVSREDDQPEQNNGKFCGKATSYAHRRYLVTMFLLASGVGTVNNSAHNLDISDDN